MLFLSSPDHTRIRRLISQPFTAYRVGQLCPAIAERSDWLLDDLDGEGDFAEAVPYPLPSDVSSTLGGVAEEKRNWFRTLIADVVPTIEPIATAGVLDRADVAGLKTAQYLLELGSIFARTDSSALCRTAV